MPISHIVLSILVLLADLVQPHQNASEKTSVLTETVESFRVEDSAMEGALRALRQKDFSRILIGFESIARRRDEKIESLSLSLTNATVGEILDQLCRQSREYTYEITDGSIIHVHPVRAQSDPPGLLDLKISEISIEANILPAAIIVRIGELAPELASNLDAKKSEYYATRHIIPGSPGAIGHGNMDPQTNLHLRNMTVREILNSIVLYSVQLRNQTPADSHGYKLPTASWIYEFIIDPNAPTGLGGIPRWIAF